MNMEYTVRVAGLFFIFGCVLPGSAFARSHHPPKGSIASDVKLINSKIAETCTPTSAYQAPLSFADNTGRLEDSLRQVAQQRDPLAALQASAKSFALGGAELGLALADLSVTGRHSYHKFKDLHDQGALTESTLVALLQTDPALSGVSQDDLYDACTRALDRAYRVANALPFGNSQDRADLGWIAVSGEDDEPTRPVNVPSTPFPQYELTVNVGTHAVHTRYSIAETLYAPPPAPVYSGRTLPVLPQPSVSPDAKVLIFVHGMDSRLEEATALTRAFQALSARTGENWTLISMDLPSSGYADDIDPQSIAPVVDDGNLQIFPPGFNEHGRQNVPIVDFIEDFVVSFVDTLDQQVPIKDKIAAVIGGSLGGNITFRMGRRSDLPWLKNTVTWSPASIWTGFADGYDLFKQIAVLTAWDRAGGQTSYLDETAGQRAQFFQESFGEPVDIGPIQIVPAQPDQWWRADWPCIGNAIQAAQLDRQETYVRAFRLWHWRLAGEQLIYSQQGAPDIDHPRYLDNHVRMLLATGDQDEFNFSDIYGATRTVAHKMVNTPGRAILLKDTGHSIHDERPNLFSREIAKFLRGWR